MKVPRGEHVSGRSNPYLTRHPWLDRGIAANREDLINDILVAAIIALLLAAIVVLSPPFFPFWFWALALIVVAVVFAWLFLPWKTIAHSPLPPDSLREHVVYELRREGLRVEEIPDGTKVRLGSVAALRFRVVPVSRGSELQYQAYATPSGWGTLITLIVLVWTSLIGVLVVVYVGHKAGRFARDRLSALVTAADNLPPPPADDIRVLLVHSLSEGHRLASDAYEAQRSALGDSAALVAIAGLAVWAFVLLGLYVGLPPGSPWREAGPLLGLATLIAVVVTGGLEWAVWRHVRPRLLASRAWAERLRLALVRETSHEPPAPAEPSSVELLMSLSEQIPAWLRIRRWAGLSGDQAAGWVVFLLSFGAFWIFWLAADFAFMAAFLYALLAGLGGTGLAVGAYFYWARWRERQEETIGRTLDEWRRRTDSLRSRFDRFLQDL